MIPVGKFLLSCYSERDEANLTVLTSRLGHFGTLFLCYHGKGSCVHFVCRQKHLAEFYSLIMQEKETK